MGMTGGNVFRRVRSSVYGEKEVGYILSSSCLGVGTYSPGCVRGETGNESRGQGTN